jgi:ribonuclease J
LIPAHQNLKGLSGYVNTANSFGYEVGRDLHISRNGNILQLTE